MMLYMFKIQRIDVNNENAKNDFFTSFQNTGFAVMENHGISFELIDKVYEESSILKIKVPCTSINERVDFILNNIYGKT